MSEMAERVAKILMPFMNDNDGRMSDAEVWESALKRARAAIEAMREPTREMIVAAYSTADDLVLARAKWEAMISAALSPSE